MSDLTPETITPFLADIFTRRGGEEYLGEPVTMAQHMLQAAHFAQEAGEDEEVIVAALLHDVGHFTSEFGAFTMDDTHDRLHEEAGAKVLAPFFPAIVTDCVRCHVAAKRYLCATDPDYFQALSAASVHSLSLQGGPMSEDEAAHFERDELFSLMLEMRTWDEAAKLPGTDPAGIEAWLPLLRRHLEQMRDAD